MAGTFGSVQKPNLRLARCKIYLLFNNAMNCWDKTAPMIDKWVSVKHWWNDTDKGKVNYSKKNLFQCRIVHHKSHNPATNRPTPGPHFVHLSEAVSLRFSPRRLGFAPRSTKWYWGGFCLSSSVCPGGCNSTSVLYSCICRPYAGKRPVETATGG